MNKTLTILIHIMLLAFVPFLSTIQVKANPIIPPGIYMYEEYIAVNVWESNGTVYARTHGTYEFSKNEKRTVKMEYPLPSDALNISILMDGKIIPWEYLNKTHKTAIGNFLMISWTIYTAPIEFNLEISYEHQIPALDRNYTYLYQLRTEPTFYTYGNTIAYINVKANCSIFNPNVYVVGLEKGNWTWNLDDKQKISRSNGVWTIETTRMAPSYKGFEGDFVLLFRRTDYIVPKDYPTIQQAIDAANPGDIISVSNGIYNEKITINKTITLYGEDRDNTIILGNETWKGEERGVSITASDVRVSGFTVVRSRTGLFLSKTTNSTLEDISVSHCDLGIQLLSSANNTVTNCELSSYIGISLGSSSNNLIINNKIESTDYGISAGPGISGNIVKSNKITGKFDELSTGILVYRNQNNSIMENTVKNFGYGIRTSGKENTVTNNNVSDCIIGVCISSTNSVIDNNLITYNYEGMWIVRDKNIIRENKITNNEYGIRIGDCRKNTIYRNNIINNTIGLQAVYIRETVVYHNNFIDNKQSCNKIVGWSDNKWDNGYPSGGNYWSDYNGTDLYSGYYQNEIGSDYIGDTPYKISDVEEDRYPLMTRYDPATYGAIEKYIELRMDYNNLVDRLNSLNMTFNWRLSNLTNLIVDLIAYANRLEQNYNDLNMTYNELLGNYNILQAYYIELQLEQEATINQLNNIQNLMYVLAMVSVVLVIATVYFGMKTTQRKSKRHREQPISILCS